MMNLNSMFGIMTEAQKQYLIGVAGSMAMTL
jgi:hypothetical protein